MKNVNVVKLYEDVQLPTRGSEGAAGWDIYAYIPEEDERQVKNIGRELVIQPGERVLVHTGLCMELPKGTFCGLYPRSGLGKRGITLANSVGVIDSDYRGEWCVLLINLGDKEFVVNNGDRIAQMIVQEYCPISFNEVDELSDSERGSGGFGSTGK